MRRDRADGFRARLTPPRQVSDNPKQKSDHSLLTICSALETHMPHFFI